MLEKTLESPLDSKEIQPVHHKGNQSWIFIGRTDVEAVTPILWLPELKSWLIWKDPDAWKDWRQEENGATEHENGWMVSLTQWTWVCINSGSWWWTARPGVLQSMRSQRVEHDWATELNWTDAEAETQILWPPDSKNWLIGKYPDAGKDWRQEEKGMTEVRWLNGIIDMIDMSLCRLRELVIDKEAILDSLTHLLTLGKSAAML